MKKRDAGVQVKYIDKRAAVRPIEGRFDRRPELSAGSSDPGIGGTSASALDNRISVEEYAG